MPLPELKKVTPVRLREIGLDERWLQDRIADDPSLLGLGDLSVLRRERLQNFGGRIDFLMHDPDSETRYEIEVMLGVLDASHIIRTIEYWDRERQRYPRLDHCAVIVAEEITGRFFNVTRLLNRAVPMIALQLSAFKFEDAVMLHFVKVLDEYESIEDEPEIPEHADPKYWQNHASGAALSVLDGFIDLVEAASKPARKTYNKDHIAVGTTGRNFCWLRPRKAGTCDVQLRTNTFLRTETVDRLEKAGLDVHPYRLNLIKLKLRPEDLEVKRAILAEVVKDCERLSSATATDD